MIVDFVCCKMGQNKGLTDRHKRLLDFGYSERHHIFQFICELSELYMNVLHRVPQKSLIVACAHKMACLHKNKFLTNWTIEDWKRVICHDQTPFCPSTPGFSFKI